MKAVTLLCCLAGSQSVVSRVALFMSGLLLSCFAVAIPLTAPQMGYPLLSQSLTVIPG